MARRCYALVYELLVGRVPFDGTTVPSPDRPATWQSLQSWAALRPPLRLSKALGEPPTDASALRSGRPGSAAEASGRGSECQLAVHWRVTVSRRAAHRVQDLRASPSFQEAFEKTWHGDSARAEVSLDDNDACNGPFECHDRAAPRPSLKELVNLRPRRPPDRFGVKSDIPRVLSGNTENPIACHYKKLPVSGIGRDLSTGRPDLGPSDRQRRTSQRSATRNWPAQTMLRVGACKPASSATNVLRTPLATSCARRIVDASHKPLCFTGSFANTSSPVLTPRANAPATASATQPVSSASSKPFCAAASSGADSSAFAAAIASKSAWLRSRASAAAFARRAPPAAWPTLRHWPADIPWVRQLRFRDEGGGPSRVHIDSVDDVVVAPSELVERSTFWSPYVVLQEARYAVNHHTVGVLVGPAMRSRGPGPFLPPPIEAVPIEDSSWRKLPLFAVTDHWGWPFFDFTFLEGQNLDVAAASIGDAVPTRDRHERYDTRPIDDSDWRELIERYWPECRRRYLELLTTASRDDRAVVFLDNDLDHQLRPGACPAQRVTVRH